MCFVQSLHKSFCSFLLVHKTASIRADQAARWRHRAVLLDFVKTKKLQLHI